ncbi:hypothetical protein BJP27_24125 (plasmid) [Pseudomonas oryzihabitans]|nr:hypothetical protein BJP27_24125 [Pseudomonas psychrotolerans]
MRFFNPYRSPRLGVELQELTLDAGIALAGHPSNQYESGLTLMLRAIIKVAESREGQVTDPLLWTVHERQAVVSHYLAHTFDEFNFPVGDSARFADYLNLGQQVAEDVPLGDIAGNSWVQVPLLGAHAEAIERLIQSRRLLDKALGWRLGAMACQLRMEPEREQRFCESFNLPAIAPEELPAALLDDWVFHRVSTLRAMPDTDFAALLDAHGYAFTQQQHLLRLWFHNDGLVLISEVPGAPPARFPLSHLFSSESAEFLGLATEPPGGADAALRPELP